MPFLDEQEFSSLKKEILDATIEKDEINSKKQELKKELDSKNEEIDKIQKKSKKTNILFGVIAGVSIAVASFLYLNQSSLSNNSDSLAFNKDEKQHVIDSITRILEQDLESNNSNDSDDAENEFEDEAETENVNDDSISQNISKIRKSTNNIVVYSVQIGVFSKNKFALLSKAIAGITTSEENLYKYSIGVFKTLKEAQKFRKQIVAIGFKDAFVASYINGKRQKIQNPD